MDFVQEYPSFPGVSESLTRYVLELNNRLLSLSIPPVTVKKSTVNAWQPPVHEAQPSAVAPAALPPAASPL